MIARISNLIKPQITELLITYLTFRADYAADLNGRLSRAYRIASDGQISQIDANTWLITPQTNGRQPYTVTFNLTWKCTCPDCDPDHGDAPTIEFCGSTQATCKHIAAVALLWTAGITLPQVEAKPDEERKARNTALPASATETGSIEDFLGYSPKETRHQPCRHCGRAWQQCHCPPTRTLPQPAKVTVLSPEAKRKFEEMLDHDKARREATQAGYEAALKPEARRRTACEFTKVQRW